MDKAAKDAIHDLVLKLRETLEGEIERELGRYGIYAERAWIDAGDLPRLSSEEREHDRPRIEAAIQREQDAGLSRAEAVQAFIRETAYTHMNRLLGLKCMEVRELINETVTTRAIYSERSQRHRDYLDEHPHAHREPDRGLVAMLRQAYAEVSRQIGVVFDPDSDYSVVWPRPTELKNYIDRINALDEEVARQQGRDPEATDSVYADDTVLGWVYQYFQEEEKARVFREASSKKISGYDIIPATTAYTERYMVQFLVENSLGALWMEMYPESDLCQRWDYFIEDPNLQDKDGSRERGREPRPVAEMTLLDPASGSGHFLLYAFDLFAQMYESEARMQGRPVDRADIARRILRDNLHGIDIDLRSVQLSALNLYMKACTYAGLRLDELQSNGSVQMNLVCADIVLRRGPEFEALLSRFKGDPLTQDLLETIWQGLENARELGSLLKPEEQLEAVVQRKRAQEQGTFWEHGDEMWDLWKEEFLAALQKVVAQAAKAFDVNRRMLGQEAIKGVQLLALLTRRYDVITTNPPYLYQRNMGASLKHTFSNLYEQAKYDLYAGFIQRCLNIGNEGALVGLVTQHSYLFLSYYSDFRRWLLATSSYRVTAHLGAGAFADITGEVVNVAASVWKSKTHSEHIATFIRLVDCPNKEAALRAVCSAPELSDKVHRLKQDHFAAIDGSPVAYWLPASFFEKLSSYDRLDTHLTVPSRTTTTNNDRFVRYQWECSDRVRKWNSKWVLYTKGGPFKKWFGNLLWAVDWSESARAHYRDHPVGRLTGEEDWFKEGITYTDLASKGFNARYVPASCVYDRSGPALLPTKEKELYYLLGLMNSRLVAFLLGLLNPTMHFQTGDIARVPYAQSPPIQHNSIRDLSALCVQKQRWLTGFDPTEAIFSDTAISWAVSRSSHSSLLGAYQVWVDAKGSAVIQVTTAEAAIDALIMDLYGIGHVHSLLIENEVGALAGQFPVLAGHEDANTGMIPEASDYLDSLPRLEPSPGSVSALKEELEKLYVGDGRSVTEISLALKVNPASVVALRRELDLVNHDDLRHEVENFLTYRIWELCKQDEDGLIPYDDGLQNPSLLEQVRGEIETIFSADRAVAIESEMDEILGRGGLARWMEDPFFRKHVSQFKKRPILWQITSPKKHFRILIYYHKLDRDTLRKVRGPGYLGGLIERARTQLRRARQKDPPDLKAIGDLEDYLADLEECDRLLESVISGTVEVELSDWAVGPYRGGRAPYDPDLDDGVRVNLLPLQEAGLLPVKKVV